MTETRSGSEPAVARGRLEPTEAGGAQPARPVATVSTARADREAPGRRPAALDRGVGLGEGEDRTGETGVRPAGQLAAGAVDLPRGHCPAPRRWPHSAPGRPSAPWRAPGPSRRWPRRGAPGRRRSPGRAGAVRGPGRRAPRRRRPPPGRPVTSTRPPNHSSTRSASIRPSPRHRRVLRELPARRGELAQVAADGVDQAAHGLRDARRPARRNSPATKSSFSSSLVRAAQTASGAPARRAASSRALARWPPL